MELAKYLCGQAHRCRCHADGEVADFGVAAHVFGNGEGALKELVQGGAQGAHFRGQTNCILHLSQNLRLTQHHRVQAAGDPKRVPSGFMVLQHVTVGLKRLIGHTSGLGEPLKRSLEGGFVGGTINFSAVTSGQNRRFSAARNDVL